MVQPPKAASYGVASGSPQGGPAGTRPAGVRGPALGAPTCPGPARAGAGDLARRIATAVVRRRADGLAVAWLGLLTFLYLLPGIVHGASFGPFDLGRAMSGLGGGAPGSFRNGWLGDEIEEFIPWNAFDWRLVHQLTFPLWNPYSALGLPQFFNFQSAVLSLPDLLGYLAPLRFSFLVAVAGKLLLAGGGVYAFSLSLGLRRRSGLFAATVFMLGGAFSNEVGWPLGDVMAWLGWVFAFSWDVYRGRREAWALPLLGLSVAGALYGGFPEGDLLLAGAWLVFFGVLAVRDAWAGQRPSLRTLAALGAAWAWGFCLAAPLWLPGLQLLAGSARLAVPLHAAIPVRALSLLLVPGYYGSPLRAGAWFGPQTFNETAVSVGSLALALALVGAWVGRRSRAVVALSATAVILLLLAYDFGPLQWLVARLPGLGAIAFGRARLPLDFALSVLAGCGMDALGAAEGRGTARRALWVALALVGAAILLLLARLLLHGGPGLSPAEARLRLQAFAPPLAVLALTALVAVAAARRPRVAGGLGGPRRRVQAAFAVLLFGQAAALLWAGAGLNAYGRFLAPSAAETALSRRVGSALVGLAQNAGGVSHYPGLGIIPELNVAYGVDEFAAYDPMVPRAYLASWSGVTGEAGAPGGWFAPAVRSAAVARTYGVSYVLAAQSPEVRLSPGYRPALARALARAGVSGAAALNAAVALDRCYASQPAARRAVPFGSPGFAVALVRWGAQVSSGSGARALGCPLGAAALPLAHLAALLPRDGAVAKAVASPLTAVPWNGMGFVAQLGPESLWRVPGAARFSLAGGGTVAAHPMGEAAWSLEVDAAAASRLIIRLTDVPGWHARIDDGPLRLSPYLGVMQAAAVPAGLHRIQLWYWPHLFSVGLGLAAFALATLGAWVAARGRRRGPPRGADPRRT